MPVEKNKKSGTTSEMWLTAFNAALSNVLISKSYSWEEKG